MLKSEPRQVYNDSHVHARSALSEALLLQCLEDARDGVDLVPAQKVCRAGSQELHGTERHPVPVDRIPVEVASHQRGGRPIGVEPPVKRVVQRIQAQPPLDAVARTPRHGMGVHLGGGLQPVLPSAQEPEHRHRILRPRRALHLRVHLQLAGEPPLLGGAGQQRRPGLRCRRGLQSLQRKPPQRRKARGRLRRAQAAELRMQRLPVAVEPRRRAPRRCGRARGGHGAAALVVLAEPPATNVPPPRLVLTRCRAASQLLQRLLLCQCTRVPSHVQLEVRGHRVSAKTPPPNFSAEAIAPPAGRRR
mmetsp:Transcript_92944/g.299101  ORF Transcript_92944/g.299101 Transcript_92944/m.299101 type:complete len:304 (-) Transcript_92944:288-1199(-)